MSLRRVDGRRTAPVAWRHHQNRLPGLRGGYVNANVYNVDGAGSYLGAQASAGGLPMWRVATVSGTLGARAERPPAKGKTKWDMVDAALRADWRRTFDDLRGADADRIGPVRRDPGGVGNREIRW